MTSANLHSWRAQTDEKPAPAQVEPMMQSTPAQAESATALKKLAEAADLLYASIDDRERRELLQFLRTDFELRHR